MDGYAKRGWLNLGGLAVLLLAGLIPAEATYTKLYRYYNTTPYNKKYMRVTLDGLEVLTDEYALPLAWTPGTEGFENNSGVLNTTYTFGIYEGVGSGVFVPPGGLAKAGWTTADTSCRLVDMRWVKYDGSPLSSISPEFIRGVPGGGQVEYDTQGNLIWVITNDTRQPLDLSNLEFGVLTSALVLNLSRTPGAAAPGTPSVEDLYALAASLLTTLKGKVETAQLNGDIIKAVLYSLRKPLDGAILLNEQGKAKYDEGNMTVAKAKWEQAADQMRLFMIRCNQWYWQGQLSKALRWLWRGDGDEVRGVFNLMPGGAQTTPAALMSAPATGNLPSAPPTDPSNPLSPPMIYAAWPLSASNGLLYPRRYTALLIPPGSLPSAVRPQGLNTAAFAVETKLMLRGWIMQGNYFMLEWEEQSTIPTDLDPPTPDIYPQPDFYGDDGTGHYNYYSHPTSIDIYSEETDADTIYWAFYNPGEDGPLNLHSYPDSAHTVDWDSSYRGLIYAMQDTSGNLSPPQRVVLDAINSTADQAPTLTITSAAATATRSGAQVVFSLSAAADMTVEVLNIAGRPVKTLVNNRQYSQGTNTLLWNAQSDHGLRVPSGTYLVRLQARTEDGKQAQRLCTVILRR